MHNEPIGFDKYSRVMIAAFQRLDKEKIYFEVKTGHQIKVNELNFYPGRGTITRDGEAKALPISGLDAFISVIRGQYKPSEHHLTIPRHHLRD